MDDMCVKLSDCLGPAFYDMHYDIEDNLHTYYNLIGGRGSLKSSVISLEIVLGIMQDPKANAVCYRKVADTLSTSVYDQICWAIDKLGVTEKWHCTSSPLRCTYRETGQVIIFKGLDKAAKSKSIKVRYGYIKYLWFEELDEYAGEEEIRKVQQSVIRGGSSFIVFKSMNPPKSNTNWANTYIEQQSHRPDTYTSHTTYLQAPEEWLGIPFIEEAEFVKEITPNVYKHEYLGEIIGTGSEVFDNLIAKRITNEEIERFDHIYNGVDWGWFPDPYHFGRMHYDSARRMLYIFGEFRANRMKNIDTAEAIKEKFNLGRYDIVTCDSAEQKSIEDYRSYGINARPAEKGPDSVRYGLKWLQSLAAIVIDPIRCPETWEEFSHYEYELTKDGQPTGIYPDEDNHSIDMTRYAMETVWRRKGR
jgi:PBSX family phage terminase large subunit